MYSEKDTQILASGESALVWWVEIETSTYSKQ